MPYKNIHWIKLQFRLMSDYRFFGMSDRSQLNYVKLLLIAGLTNNKIPKNYQNLRSLLRTDCSELELKESIDEIRKNFPKVIETNEFYKIRGFKELHNWVSPGSSEGEPKESVDKIRQDRDKIESRSSLEFFRSTYRQRFKNEYIVLWAKDMSILKGLLQILSEAELRELIVDFINSDDPFMKKAGYTVGIFKTQIEKLRALRRQGNTDGVWGYKL